MIKMDYPTPEFRLRGAAGKEEIFDEIRKAWVRLTPEEWVRQNVINWMVRVLDYPSGLISVEKALSVGSLKKRFDVLLFDQTHRPWMLVECKAPSVDLSEKTLMQILRYNMKVQAEFLVITNGHYCFVADIRAAPAAWISKMPAFPGNSAPSPANK